MRSFLQTAACFFDYNDISLHVELGAQIESVVVAGERLFCVYLGLKSKVGSRRKKSGHIEQFSTPFCADNNRQHRVMQPLPSREWYREVRHEEKSRCSKRTNRSSRLRKNFTVRRKSRSDTLSRWPSWMQLLESCSGTQSTLNAPCKKMWWNHTRTMLMCPKRYVRSSKVISFSLW